MPLSNRVCFIVNLRDQLRCRRCGKRPQSPENYHRGFEYHHRLPRSEGGLDMADNIVLLCHACHQQTHQDKPLTPQEQPQAALDLSPPATFLCATCQTTLDSYTVTMNCGWYRCHACQSQVHLFQHFCLASE